MREFVRAREDPADNCDVPDACSPYDCGLSEKPEMKVYPKIVSDKAVMIPEVYVCDLCHKEFTSDTEEPACPYCHARYVPTSELEEVDPMKEGVRKFDMLRDSDPSDFVIESELKFDEWQDARKEQISLEMGSPEYKEYLEDLQANDPGRPDDEMHADLEAHNEDLVTDGYDLDPDEVSDRDADEFREMQVNKRFEKQALHEGVMKAAMDRALSTDTKSDDRAVRRMSLENLAMLDPSVSVDDYENEVLDHIDDMSL